MFQKSYTCAVLLQKKLQYRNTIGAGKAYLKAYEYGIDFAIYIRHQSQLQQLFIVDERRK